MLTRSQRLEQIRRANRRNLHNLNILDAPEIRRASIAETVAEFVVGGLFLAAFGVFAVCLLAM